MAFSLWLIHLDPLALTGRTPSSSNSKQCFKSVMMLSSSLHFLGDFYETNSSEYCLKVTSCIKSRLAWSNMDLIRDIIFMLGTQGWQKLFDDEHVTEPPLDDLGDSQENPMDAILWLFDGQNSRKQRKA